MAGRNPNGYGSVSRLSGNRARPWVVRVTVYGPDGLSRQAPVGYAATKEEAMRLLAEYNDSPWDADRERVTVAELHSRWLEARAGRLGASLRGQLAAAYAYLAPCYGMKYRAVRAHHMQECVDSCARGPATKAAVRNLWRHLDRFAYETDVVVKTYSQLLEVPPAPETTRTPFTLDQVEALWGVSGEPWVDSALMYVYTGFRLNELLGMGKADVDLGERVMRGGLKTAAGRGRLVPIHDRIMPLVEARMRAEGDFLLPAPGGGRMAHQSYYPHWRAAMRLIGADKTPHEARHTFETLLDNAGGNRRCIDLLMGHASRDVGNRVYNHKTLEQLRETVALLP